MDEIERRRGLFSCGKTELRISSQGVGSAQMAMSYMT
jgi:hypothetical protein